MVKPQVVPPMLLLCLIAMGASLRAATPGGANGPDVIVTDTFDIGGLRSTNATYTNVGSIGGIEAVATSTSNSASYGYIAQLPYTYVWNGGTGTWAVTTTGWDAGAWSDNNDAIIGTGADTAGIITAASAISPNSITFNTPLSGAYTLVVNGTIATGGPVVAGAGVTIRGTGGTINRTIQTSGTSASVWPGAATLGAAVSSGESLTLAGLDLSSGGKLKIAANGANAQQLILSTGAACNLSNSTLSVGVTAGSYSKTYIILDATAVGNVITATVEPIKLLQPGVTIQYIDASNNSSATLVNHPSNRVQITLGSVTPVKIAQLNAKPEGAGVTIAWNAVSEFKNVGFNLYRRALQDPRSSASTWKLVNLALIAGRITNPDEKHYSCYDWAPSGTYEYKLESVGVMGELESFYPESGPVGVDWNTQLSSNGAVTFDTLNAATDNFVMEASAARAAEIGTRFGAQYQGVQALSAISMHTLDGRSAAIASDRPLDALTTRSVSSSALSFGAAVAGVRWFIGGAGGATVGHGSSSYTAAKVVYVSRGVMLIPQGSLPAGFDLNHVSLQREGRGFPALAMTPAGLLVYAPGYQDDYTDKDAIFLRRITGNTMVGPNSPATGLFATQMPLNVTSQATVTNSYHDVYFDFLNYRPYTYAPWFSGQYLTDGTAWPFALNTPLASSGAASLAINLWSLTDNSATVNQDHSLQVMLNHTPLGQAVWSGGGRMLQLSFTIPKGVLLNGGNIVSLVTPSIAGSSQVAFLHSMTVNYTRLLDGSKPFSINNTSDSPQLYELYNIPAMGAYVIDTRFADHAALMPTQTQAQPDGTLRLRFMADSGQYLVVPVGQEHVPLAVNLRQVKAVRLSGTYLATGPSQFATGVQPLLAARAKEGIRGIYIDQEQLFDYYNHGRFGPTGIQNAVRSVHPQYLLLLGRTTYDYRNYSGLNVDPLCPTFLVSTSFWSQTTSDSMFGDLGRGYPEVAVGRLPVCDASEMSTVVNRILDYKGLPAASGIRLQAVADRADPSAGDFASQLGSIHSAHLEMTWQENYLGVTYQSSGEVHNAMTTAANGGADLILYAGHGNASRLGLFDQRILDNSTIADWTGNVVFIQATCTANWAANNDSNYHSIAMRALTQPGGGIAASIASSTYMNSDAATAFVNQLLNNTESGTNMRWGTALLKTQQWALQQSAATAFYTDLGNTEQIFGDPAMRIYAAPARTAVPGSGASSLSIMKTQAGRF